MGGINAAGQLPKAWTTCLSGTFDTTPRTYTYTATPTTCQQPLPLPIGWFTSLPSNLSGRGRSRVWIMALAFGRISALWLPHTPGHMHLTPCRRAATAAFRASYATHAAYLRAAYKPHIPAAHACLRARTPPLRLRTSDAYKTFQRCVVGHWHGRMPGLYFCFWLPCLTWRACTSSLFHSCPSPGEDIPRTFGRALGRTRAGTGLTPTLCAGTCRAYCTPSAYVTHHATRTWTLPLRVPTAPLPCGQRAACTTTTTPHTLPRYHIHTVDRQMPGTLPPLIPISLAFMDRFTMQPGHCSLWGSLAWPSPPFAACPHPTWALYAFYILPALPI